MTDDKINFWRDNSTIRTTNTGINENVILRKNLYTNTEKNITFLKSKINKNTIMRSDNYYKSIIFDCIKRLKENKVGYVFNEHQVKDVLLLYKNRGKLKFIHNYYNNIWYVYSKKIKKHKKVGK